MWPAVVVDAIQRVVAAGAQQVANGNVHQVLFFLLGKTGTILAGLLDTNEKKYGVQVGPFSKPFHQLGLQGYPTLREAVLSVGHGCKETIYLLILGS